MMVKAECTTLTGYIWHLCETPDSKKTLCGRDVFPRNLRNERMCEVCKRRRALLDAARGDGDD